MAALNANNYYQQSQVTTASRGQLLLLAYDGALRFISEGKRALQVDDFERKNTTLQKAQALLMELRYSLDHRVAPELCASLDYLYRHMHGQLMYANVYDDAAVLDEVAGMLTELRETWAEAEHLARETTDRVLTAGGVA